MSGKFPRQIPPPITPTIQPVNEGLSATTQIHGPFTTQPSIDQATASEALKARSKQKRSGLIVKS